MIRSDLIIKRKRAIRVLFSMVWLLFIAAVAYTGGQPENVENGVSEASPQNRTMSMVVPSGVPAITIAGVDTGIGQVLEGYELDVEVLASPDALAARLISEEADFAIVPTNLGAQLMNRGVDVRMAGAAVWGILYVVAREPISDWSDLAGREIGMLGRGLTPDVVFRYLAREKGLDPQSDFTLRYVNASTELAPTFLTGGVDTSLMPEPMLTSVLARDSEAAVVLDLQSEWAEVTGTGRGYPQAILLMRGDVVDEHRDFVAAFVDEFAESVGRVVSDPETFAPIAADLIDGISAEIILAAMPRANLEYVPAVEARESVESYFEIIREADPAALGGELPGDSFYLELAP